MLVDQSDGSEQGDAVEARATQLRGDVSAAIGVASPDVAVYEVITAA
jgi:hypothetical protein